MVHAPSAFLPCIATMFCPLLFLSLCAQSVGSLVELHDFGKILATGLCKLPGLSPIVSFPRWGDLLTPDQPKIGLAVVINTGLHPIQAYEQRGLHAFGHT